LLFQCDCFNKKVQALYEMPVDYYHRLAHILGQCDNLEQLTVYLQDNRLNPHKAQIFEESIMNIPRLNYFWLSNCVFGFNIDH
jgi:predicted metal-dependent HD superfamily phosphohydrolase